MNLEAAAIAEVEARVDPFVVEGDLSVPSYPGEEAHVAPTDPGEEDRAETSAVATSAAVPGFRLSAQNQGKGRGIG